MSGRKKQQMSASSEARDWVVTIEQLGASREFGAAELPITIGGDRARTCGSTTCRARSKSVV